MPSSGGKLGRLEPWSGLALGGLWSGNSVGVSGCGPLRRQALGKREACHSCSSESSTSSYPPYGGTATIEEINEFLCELSGKETITFVACNKSHEWVSSL